MAAKTYRIASWIQSDSVISECQFNPEKSIGHLCRKNTFQADLTAPPWENHALSLGKTNTFKTTCLIDTTVKVRYFDLTVSDFCS